MFNVVVVDRITGRKFVVENGVSQARAQRLVVRLGCAREVAFDGGRLRLTSFDITVEPDMEEGAR